jgi:hypothetical protein
MTAAVPGVTRSYDLICFGDEVPGILAMVAAAREYKRRTGKLPKTLLMFKGNSQEGVGGHLVRGGLGYLDRSFIPPSIQQAYGVPAFGDPASLYKEFLQRSGVAKIGLDPQKANVALRRMLSEVGTDIVSKVQIQSVLKESSKLTGIYISRGETYLAKQFIDCTVNAELAQYAGVQKLQGFGTFGLPESELPVTLVFETQGLTIQQLKQAEESYLKRFSNASDTQAQKFLRVAAGNDPKFITLFQNDMLDKQGKLKTMHVGQDFIDVRSRALSIAYHSFRGKKLSLQETGMALDCGNVAILAPDRLSWNALLFHVSGSKAENLARNASKPTPEMLQEVTYLEQWFKSIGAKAVKPATELYIRHAGNVTGVVEPLSGARMLAGAVPANQALATFGYYLDVRGGIEGLGPRATQLGAGSITFHTPPLFNVGIHHALIRNVPNLAVVSPASGFDGYACAAGRIVEFNVAVGQGVGIAASIAICTGRNLAEISNLDVRQVLAQTGQLPKIYGTAYSDEAIRLQAFELALLPTSTVTA